VRRKEAVGSLFRERGWRKLMALPAIASEEERGTSDDRP
jgi:hypothetical protein